MQSSNFEKPADPKKLMASTDVVRSQHGMATIDNLANRFILKLWGVSRTAHLTISYAQRIAWRSQPKRVKSTSTWCTYLNLWSGLATP